VVMPPSMTSVCPVTKLDASLARYSTPGTSSAGSAIRLMS